MSIVEALLDSAYQDTQSLIGNNKKGDDFNISRDIDFILYAGDASKADTVSSFINDNQYGNASFEEVDGKYRILVVLHMQATQNLICSVSGLMTCIAKIFQVDYDGWGCVLQNT